MFRIVAAALLFSLSSNAMAAGWTADRVRGEVLVEAGSSWEQVQRGIEINDGARLKTGASGRVDLSRGKDHFSLGANTSVQIRDSGPDLMTSVIQSAGVVSVDVERRNVQHFSVQTPFLAAVVKGTRFTVTSDSSGSHVDVDRGVVQVQDNSNDLVADVHPGQTADVTNEAPLQVEGTGATPVYTTQGIIVSTNGNRETPANDGKPEASASQTNNQKQNGQSGNNGSGNAENGKGSGSGNSGNGNAGGGNNGNGNAGGNSGNGNGNSGGDNGNGNGGGGNNGNGNAGGNSGNGNGNSGGNNGNGNGGGNEGSGDGNGNSGTGDGNGGGNNGNGNGNGGGNGNGNGNGNSGGNDGNGNGNNGNGNGRG